jgi:uncharacterized protein (TIGR02001 family)
MTALKTLCQFGASLLALPMLLTAQAQAQTAPEYSGNVALSTDYVWRGISQSNGDIALSGGFDASFGAFYAGVWGSNVDFDNAGDTNFELDIYGGVTGEFPGGVTWDVGFISYIYPDSGPDDLDFVEVKGGLGYAFESGFEVGGTLFYDPDNKNLYSEASAAYGFTDTFGVDVTLGQYSFDQGDDYTNWSLGGTLSAAGFDFGLRYTGTDIDSVEIADDRVVFSIARAL